jgi:hypothetical protein
MSERRKRPAPQGIRLSDETKSKISELQQWHLLEHGYQINKSDTVRLSIHNFWQLKQSQMALSIADPQT